MRSGVLFFALCLIGFQGSIALDQALRDFFLREHNDSRSQLALGKTKNKNGTLLPSASDMYELKYSLEVEKIAQDYADKCSIKHVVVNHITSNLFARHPYEEINEIAKQGVNAWLDELKYNGLPSLKFTNQVSHSNVSHWIEINWNNVKEIGCGIANCPMATGDLEGNPPDHWTFLVCEYRPGGNYLNDPIYTPGPPCSRCTAYPNSKCNDQTGLCYIDDGKHTTKHSTSTKVSTTSTAHSSSSKTSTIKHTTKHKTSTLRLTSSKTSTKTSATKHQTFTQKHGTTILSRTLNPVVRTTTSNASKA